MDERRHGRPVPELSAAALDRLVTYPWPGNVRELENCLESAVVILDGDRLLPENLSLPARLPTRPPTPVRDAARSSVPASDDLQPLEEVERAHVLRVLAAVGDNRSEAARILRIGRNTLLRKLKDWGVE